MKKFTTAIAAAAVSAGMIAGAGVAAAQDAAANTAGDPNAKPEVSSGTNWAELLNKTPEAPKTKEASVSADDPVTPNISDPSNTIQSGEKPNDAGALKCEDGTHYEIVNGNWFCKPDKEAAPAPEAEKPAPKPEAEKPSNDGIPPAVEDTANCPDGPPRDMGKKDPVTGVFGYCAPKTDEAKPEDKPGKEETKPEEKPGKDDKKKDVDVKVDVKISAEKKSDDCKKSEECKKDEKKADESKKDMKKADEKKVEKKAAPAQNSGLAATGVDAATLGGAALALLVGGVAATRFARKDR